MRHHYLNSVIFEGGEEEEEKKIKNKQTKNKEITLVNQRREVVEVIQSIYLN